MTEAQIKAATKFYAERYLGIEEAKAFLAIIKDMIRLGLLR